MASPVLNATLTPDEKACSAQLYDMPMMLCKSTALRRIVNAGTQEARQEGLEAWRVLVEAHAPPSFTRSADLLQELISFSFEDDITGRIAHHDRDVDRYAKTRGEMLPPNIRVHVAGGRDFVLTSRRITGWNLLTAEIDNVRREQAVVSNNPRPRVLSQVAHQPQDINALPKGKSEGKGKDKGKQHGGKGSVIDKPKSPSPISSTLGH